MHGETIKVMSYSCLPEFHIPLRYLLLSSCGIGGLEVKPVGFLPKVPGSSQLCFIVIFYSFFPFCLVWERWHFLNVRTVRSLLQLGVQYKFSVVVTVNIIVVKLEGSSLYWISPCKWMIPSPYVSRDQQG